MPIRKYKPEQIVTLLRQVEVGLANGKSTPQACKEAEITAQTYYLVSQETSGGDQWYDYGTVTTSAIGTVTSAVYSSDGASWLTLGGANTSYVPPNVK